MNRPIRHRTAHRRALGAAALGITVAVFTGCAGTPTSTTSPGDSTAPKTDYTFYMVPGMTTHPAYITMYCGGQEAAAELGVKLEFTGATQWDAAQQIPVVQALLAKSPSALLLTPNDGAALQPVVAQFNAANIPVVALDTTLNDNSGLAAEISSSNEQGGAAAADALGKAIGGTGTVAIISGAPGATTDQARVKGFQEEMKKSFPNVKLLEPQYSKSVVATAESEVQALMLANSDLKGVFGVNGNSATGAASAIVNQGKKGQIFVAGYDAEPATVEQLKKGNISILVVQDFMKEGRLGVEAAYKAVTGDKASIQTPQYLDNIIATTENASDPNVSKYFYTESCK